MGPAVVGVAIAAESPCQVASTPRPALSLDEQKGPPGKGVGWAFKLVQLAHAESVRRDASALQDGVTAHLTAKTDS
jgi:hypothetical protein